MTHFPRIILASSSIYRSQLLARLKLDFVTQKPMINESPLVNEAPEVLVERLSRKKAETVATQHSNAIIIGSDQIMVLENTQILGKPLTTENAQNQLIKISGQTVKFITGLCVINTANNNTLYDQVSFTVKFRSLNRSEIKRYIEKENPIDCAGSFKSEALGISLISEMRGSDSTALIGLPLIKLSQMLRENGLNIP